MKKLINTDCMVRDMAKSMSGFLGTDKEWGEYNEQKNAILNSNVPITANSLYKIHDKIKDLGYSKTIYICDNIVGVANFIYDAAPLNEITEQLDELYCKYEWRKSEYINDDDLFKDNEAFGKGKSMSMKKRGKNEK